VESSVKVNLPVQQPADPASAPVCRLLRTKTAYGSLEGMEHAWHEGASTTAVFWCLGTMETAGLDDGYVHPHTCCAGRTCYKPPPE
jgi:hypothetical protein